MASPVDSARQGTNITSASTGPHAINVGSPVSGTLLVLAFRFASDPGTVTFTGYTVNSLGVGNLYRAYRQATGSEGATDDLSTGNSVKLAAICWEITGAADPATQAPESSGATGGFTTANSINPPSRAVTGGPKDVLYLAIAGMDGELNDPTAAPTNYGNLQTANSGTAGSAAGNCTMGGASRAISASSSDDPGVFTHAAPNSGGAGFTIVIHPAAAAAPGPPADLLKPPLRRRASRYATFR